MQNQIKSASDQMLPPDGCGIIIEFYDVANDQPGPDSGNATDVMDARVKSVTFVRNIGEPGEPGESQMLVFKFNQRGEITITEKSGGVFDIIIPDHKGDIYYLVPAAKIL